MSTITATDLRHHRFTLGQYEEMISLGILGPDDRVELLDGEIIEMSPIGPPHAGIVDRLNRLLSRAVDDRAVVRVQNPLWLSMRSQPQPDLALASPRDSDYLTAHPAPSDVLLVIEVADASLAVDRNVKLPLYAEGRISEVWIVDILGKQIEVYRQPAGSNYRDVQAVRPGNVITIAALPDIEIDVADIIRD